MNTLHVVLAKWRRVAGVGVVSVGGGSCVGSDSESNCADVSVSDIAGASDIIAGGDGGIGAVAAWASRAGCKGEAAVSVNTAAVLGLGLLRLNQGVG